MVKKGSKKSKKGKKKESIELKEEISEVDKEYFQIIINDLQAQVAKLTDRCQQLETHNTGLQGDFRQLDEKSANVIAFLRRQLDEKCSEIVELQERLTGLAQARKSEGDAFEKRIADLQHTAQVNEEQLSAEIKLLNGKLNSLEEFRLQKNDLNEKFAKQEEEIKQKDVNHENALQEVERNFILSKNRLKKEMEEQLLSLSEKFQAATATRMAATTQRAVHENLALTAEVARIRADALFQRSLTQTQETKITELKREVKVLKDLLQMQSGQNSKEKEKCKVKKSKCADKKTQTEKRTAKFDDFIHEDCETAPKKFEKEEYIEEDENNQSFDDETGSQDLGSSKPAYSRGNLGFVSK
ncbi:cilia- and flagella-associated protein 157 [Neocloeon triangulifer]|uniref:cilia- and flagella-associated protein 157 n=1 Tax=Neocloeon triangulifer TaxID=2078957 RepID=UPI00286ECA93|nr:cilia- and flagella-associated protein 157 [Neocloeon triangulifer]